MIFENLYFGSALHLQLSATVSRSCVAYLVLARAPAFRHQTVTVALCLLDRHGKARQWLTFMASLTSWQSQSAGGWQFVLGDLVCPMSSGVTGSLNAVYDMLLASIYSHDRPRLRQRNAATVTAQMLYGSLFHTCFLWARVFSSWPLHPKKMFYLLTVSSVIWIMED